MSPISISTGEDRRNKPRQGIIGRIVHAIETMGEGKCLLLIFLAAVILRVAFYLIVFEHFKGTYGWMADDNYDEIARNVLAGYGYVIRPGLAPNTVRTPLYVYFLVLHFVFFGYSRISIVLVQSTLQAGACLLLYRLTKKLFNNPGPSLLAALGLAVYPQSMLYASQYLTESLYLFLIMVMALSFIRLLERPSKGMYASVGFLLGVLTLCRPISQLLILPVAITIFFHLRQRGQRKFGGIVTMVMVFLVVLSPWTLRNYLVTGDFIPVSTRGGRFLYSNTIASQEEEETVLKHLRKEGNLSPGDEDAEWFDLAFRNIIERPGRFLRNTLHTGLDFWYRGHSFAISVFNALVNFPLLLFAVCGVVLKRNRWKDVMPIIVIILYFNGMYSILHAISRYSLPVIPFICMFASVGILDLLGRITMRREVGQGDQWN